jgi:hypothetical protein
MAWGIENKSHEKFNILFTGDDDVDIVISCDERSENVSKTKRWTQFTKLCCRDNKKL